MTLADFAGRIARVSKKPPGFIVERIQLEARMRAERFLAPRRSRRMTPENLAAAYGHATVNAWWAALGRNPYLANLEIDPHEYDTVCPGDRDRIEMLAGKALSHRVELLGSGEIELGDTIDWQRDYKTGFRWPHGYCTDLEYGKRGGGSDVKFPWDLSRLQWLIPVGQAYLLTGDERYAEKARDVISCWISDNPHAGSINWACTMEVALRIISLSWLFHAFRGAAAWRDERFRGELLRSMHLHADFTSRHLEKSDINGNHYTADAAGLVYAGLFFGNRGPAATWLDLGWKILREELPRQVYADGVDFEASIAYHRLVQELFLMPALYRQACGLAVDPEYRSRLVAMAEFSTAYSRPDGTVPLVGDADDARTLPFGGQGINDHRYLSGISGVGLDDAGLRSKSAGSLAEVFWLLGAKPAMALSAENKPMEDHSRAFREGGYFVLRNDADHVFVNCAPLGLGGRGGHSHNDSLSFEAVLNGVHLVSDCGAYVYTSDYDARNLFRSTAFHNTPRVDGEEINRFVSADFLWGLRNDAKPDIREISLSSGVDRLILSHSGYARLSSPVVPVRTITLNHATHSLSILDEFEGSGEHTVEIPVHFAIGVHIEPRPDGTWELTSRGSSFILRWSSKGEWKVDRRPARISPSYGIAISSEALVWTLQGKLDALEVVFEPADSSP